MLPIVAEEPIGGKTVIEQAIVVEAGCERVWEFFQSLPDVAACLPGAGLTRHDADSWEGTIRIKIGPISAQLRGKGTYKLVEAERTGGMVGAGADELSSSRVRGSLDFALRPAGNNTTSMALTISYTLQGALAQFSRSNLAKDFVRVVVQEFGRNVSARLSGASAPAQVTDFRLLRILRLLIASWRCG
jgi:carbon-monoxide dehydrogenase small subunit